jgi:hypothetical protein
MCGRSGIKVVAWYCKSIFNNILELFTKLSFRVRPSLAVSGKCIVSMYRGVTCVHDVLTGQLRHTIMLQNLCTHFMPVPDRPSLLIVGQHARDGDQLYL